MPAKKSPDIASFEKGSKGENGSKGALPLGLSSPESFCEDMNASPSRKSAIAPGLGPVVYLSSLKERPAVERAKA